MRILGSVVNLLDAEAALPVMHAHIATLRRYWPRDWSALEAQGELASCYHSLGRKEEALHLLRHIYKKRKATKGPTDRSTIIDGCNLSHLAGTCGLYAEARQLAREQLGVARSTLGEDNEVSLHAAKTLALSLICFPTTRANILEAEALITDAISKSRRVVGAEHPRMRELGDALEKTRERLNMIDSGQIPDDYVY